MFCVIYVWGKALKESTGYEFFPVNSLMYIHSMVAETAIKNRRTIFGARTIKNKDKSCP